MTGTGLLYDQDATSTFTWKHLMNVPSVPNGVRDTGFEPAPSAWKADVLAVKH